MSCRVVRNDKEAGYVHQGAGAGDGGKRGSDEH